MVQPIAIQDVPSATSIYADCWQGKESFKRLVPRHFLDAGSYVEQAKLVQARRYDRERLVEVLREQNERLATGPKAREQVLRLADASSLVVIGGQQAGLFGGPLYTVHKALTILVLARRMEQELGRAVVPVFWIASEDSDLAEVNHAFVLDREGLLRELRLRAEQDGKVPVSAVRLGEPVGRLIEELASLLPETAAAAETLADLRAAYTPGRTFTQAFGAWMGTLFHELGLVLVDPSDVRLKRLARGLFGREITERSPVSAAVREQTARLVRAGYAPQIELRDGLLTLFHQDPAREAIAVTDKGFELKGSGARFTTEALADLLERAPELFTPNAVLRPLFQDTIFPTLAVVLGPAEVAYFTQLTLAYERMGIPMPIVFPRASVTVVEAKITSLLAKLAVDLKGLLARGERIIDDIVRREIPPGLVESLARGKGEVRELWAGLAGEIERLDPSLRRTADLAAGRAMGQFDFMEKKVVKAERRKDAVRQRQVARLVASLAPRGGLQERTHSALPLLARHGKAVLARIADGIDPFSPVHHVIEVDP